MIFFVRFSFSSTRSFFIVIHASVYFGFVQISRKELADNITLVILTEIIILIYSYIVCIIFSHIIFPNILNSRFCDNKKYKNIKRDKLSMKCKIKENIFCKYIFNFEQSISENIKFILFSHIFFFISSIKFIIINFYH